MRKSIGSSIALNRRALLLLSVVLSLAVFGLVTWRISARNISDDNSPGDAVDVLTTGSFGNGTFTLTKPATGFVHQIGWTANSGRGDAQSDVLLLLPPSLVLVPATLPGGSVGSPYIQTLTASGGTPPYSTPTV